MWGILYKLSVFVISGLIFRLLASIGFGLATQHFVKDVVSGYLNKGVTQMRTALSPDVSAYLGIARVDDCISILIGTITFIATYKSLKIIFIRQM